MNSSEAIAGADTRITGQKLVVWLSHMLTRQ